MGESPFNGPNNLARFRDNSGDSLLDRRAGALSKSDDNGATWTPIGGGSTSLPSTQILADAATNTAPDGVVERHTSSGTAAPGFGLTNAVELQNGSGSTIRAMADIATLTTVTAGSEVAKRAIQVMTSGALAEVVAFLWQNPTLAAIMLGGFSHVIRASSSVLQFLNAGSNGLSLAAGNVSTVSANLQCDQRFYQKQGANVASATTVTLGNDGNEFQITGSTTINGITTAGWAAGSRITLVLQTSGIVVTNNSGAPGGGAVAIQLRAGANLTTAKANYVLDLVYDGTFWRQPD